MNKFISYYPLKQGLKQDGTVISDDDIINQFISYYPLKQGLKLLNILKKILGNRIYILLSIKTRIETTLLPFLSLLQEEIYILLSIKTRIETEILLQAMFHQSHLYPTIH